VAYWVRDAWAEITESCIVNTWCHIGIVGIEDRENVDPNAPAFEVENDDTVNFENAEMEALTESVERGSDFQVASED
jgi:hypothetical protein